jgi:nucleoside-diphosphate-sugar epimerase
MKSAVITGANGFIGKVLTKKLLEQNYIVYAIVTNVDDMKDFIHTNLYCIKAFYEDYEDLLYKLPSNIEVFYHFAWQGVFGESFKDYNLQLKNVMYVGNAIMIAIKLGVKKFVLASTVNTLETKKYFSMQSFQPRYTNIYATSKLAAEMIGKTLAFNNKIEFNCGIIGMVYGENNYSRMIPNIVISNLIYGRETNLIDGDTPYDVIYVDDVC